MTLRKLLLGTTAILGAGIISVAIPQMANAQEVTPGGQLNIKISGFARFRAHGGDLDAARNNDSDGADADPEDADESNGLDFSNDTEVHIIVSNKHELTGLEYGGTVEFEADTNRTDNTDESWLFIRGGFGEVRLGDEDGVADNSAIGAQTVAAGTGGIDGSVIDVFAGGVNTFKGLNSNDSTKIRYYTPSFGGLQFGISYTPQLENTGFGGGSGSGNGDSLATKDADAEHFTEAGVVYKGDFGGIGLQASVLGTYCDYNDDNTGATDDECWGVYGGAATTLFGFKIGGGLGTLEFGAVEQDYFNIGAGAALGPANVSVNYGMVIDSENLPDGADEPYNLVFSADVGLMPGLVLAGDVGFFDNDDDDDGDGWQAVGRLGLAF